MSRCIVRFPALGASALEGIIRPDVPTLVTGHRSRRSMLTLLGGAALTALFAFSDENEADAASCVTTNEVALLRLINAYRASNGLSALKMSSTVAAAAYAHSRDMATRNYFNHTTKGKTIRAAERMTAAGYPYIGNTSWGEIIYRGSGSLASAAEAFDSWKNSSGHNALMLGSQFTAAGVGRSNGSGASTYTYSTVNFAGKFDRAASSC